MVVPTPAVEASVVAPVAVKVAAVSVPVNVGDAEKATFVVPVVPLTVVPWILATVVAKDPVPLPVTSDVKVIV